MSEIKNVEDMISLDTHGFSNILRNARELKGMSLADVGKALRLDESVIYAIENNKSERLPEPAYVCGYIRNYARLMELDPLPLVENFKENSTILTKLNSVTSSNRKLEKKEEKRSVLFLVFLVILLVLGVFFGWQLWQGKALELFSTEKGETKEPSSLSLNQSQQTNTSLSQTDNNETINTSLTLIDEANHHAVEEKNTATPQSDTSNVSTKPLEQEVNQETNDNSIINNEVALDQEALDQEVLDQGADKNGSQLSDNKSQMKVSTNNKDKETDNSKKKLEFKFSKNSWISVKDSTKKSLIYDLVHKGEIITLYGKAPVNIFLGDGTGVELSIDGKTYDFSRDINGKNIAKFVVK